MGLQQIRIPLIFPKSMVQLFDSGGFPESLTESTRT